MISIYKYSPNVVVLTLTEKCLLTSPYFLFELKSVQTKSYQYFIPYDLSTETQRFNKFLIVETGSPTIRQTSLTVGDYEYTIYEQASNTNLVPTGLNVVEVGYLTCYPLVPIVNNTYTNANLINLVYNA